MCRARATVYLAGRHSTPLIFLLQGARQVFAETPEGTTFSAKSFSDLHLSRPLIRACQALGYQHPTPIQVRNLHKFFACCTILAACGAH